MKLNDDLNQLVDRVCTPVPSPNGDENKTSKKRKHSGTEQQYKDENGTQNKKTRSDPALDCFHHYDSSGLKRSQHGVVYQVKLLMLFVKRATKQHYDFRLATEMDAAEKFDDVALKYKDSSNQWKWRFVQAKHMLKQKITVKDLISRSNKEPFALHKYFISFCLIKTKPIFQDFLEDFTIVTNTDFDFMDQTASECASNVEAREFNNDEKKWKRLLEEQKYNGNDPIFGFQNDKFKPKQFCFCSSDTAKTDLIKFCSSSLLRNALDSAEISHWPTIGDKIKNIFDFSKFVEQEMQEVKEIKIKMENDIKRKKHKFKLLKSGQELLKIAGEILGKCGCDSLKSAIEALIEQKVNPQVSQNIIEESKQIVQIIDQRYIEISDKLNKYKDSESEESRELKKEEDEINRVEEELRRIQKNIAKYVAIEFIKNETKTVCLKKRVPKLDSILNGTDISLMKDSLNSFLDETISEISAIKVALSDDTFEVYLTEFLSKFRIITNYPNEDELGGLIGKELGSAFNLIDADLITNSFEIEMLNFLKEYDKRATFYSWKSANDFFSRVKKQINTLVSIGLNLAYTEKLSTYSMKFKENLQQLHDFFHNDHQILHLSNPFTRLGAILVFRNLEMSTKFEQRDSYIFTSLRTLTENVEAKRSIVDAFGKKEGLRSSSTHKKVYHIYAIECQRKGDQNMKKEEDLFNNHFITILQQNPSKKMIFIAPANDEFVKLFTNKYKHTILNETVSFESLDEDSQNKILSKEINFQGNDVALRKLIDQNLAKQIIDEAILLRLLKGRQIVIGDRRAFDFFGYEKEYYISRSFCLIDQTKTRSISEADLIKHEAKVVIIANDPGEGKSTVLTSMARQIANLTEEVDETYQVWVVRINLNDYATDKIHPNSLHNVTFESDNIQQAIDFVLKMMVFGNPDHDANISLQQKMFEIGLQSHDTHGLHSKIVILFDGFDEISPIFKDKTTILLHALKRSNVFKLWITTRNNEKPHLEKELGSSSCILKALDKTMQKEFLNKFWKYRIKCQPFADVLKYLRDILSKNDNKENKGLMSKINSILKKYRVEDDQRLKELQDDIDKKLNLGGYANKLLGKWQNKMSDKSKQFILNPLHLKILSEVVLAEKFQLPNEFSSLYLYQKFITTKIDIYYQKAKMNQDNPTAKAVIKRDTKAVNKIHSYLAVKILLPDEYAALPGLNDLNEMKESFEDNELARIGILVPKGATPLDFIHRSFAEYFKTDFMVDNLNNKQVQILLIEEILSRKRHELVRQFLNDRLKDRPNQTPIEIDLTVNENESVPEYLVKSQILNILASEGHDEIMKLLLKWMEVERDEFITKFADPIFKAYLEAITSHRNNIANEIHKFCSKMNYAFYKNNILGSCEQTDDFVGNESECHPLIVAARSGNIDVILTIIEKLRQVYDEDSLGKLLEKYLHLVLVDLIDLKRLNKKPDCIGQFLECVQSELGNTVLKNLIEKKVSLKTSIPINAIEFSVEKELSEVKDLLQKFLVSRI